MNKFRNLEELESLVGRESLEKCLMEYILTVIGQARRLDDLQDRCAVMDEDEMEDFVRRVGKAGLPAGRKDHGRDRVGFIQGVQAALLVLGYREKWVLEDLAGALDREYLK